MFDADDEDMKRYSIKQQTQASYIHIPPSPSLAAKHTFGVTKQAALQSCITKHSSHASLSSKRQFRTSMTALMTLKRPWPLSIRSRLSSQTRLMLLPTTAAYCCLALVYLVCLRGLRCKRRAPWHHWGCIRDLSWRIEGE